ncbi:Uncharacterized protein HZ326_2223 [Fusarium oxysporum f. sp. albedinis]|nr:Uncharacterized protein HZ326_2223 [Fusarium oxysporum f. sp. albedinis]
MRLCLHRRRKSWVSECFSVDELFDQDPKKRLRLIVGPSSRTRGILDLEHLSPQGGHHSDVPDANLHSHQIPRTPKADLPRRSLVSIRLARGHWISFAWPNTLTNMYSAQILVNRGVVPSSHFLQSSLDTRISLDLWCFSSI